MTCLVLPVLWLPALICAQQASSKSVSDVRAPSPDLLDDVLDFDRAIHDDSTIQLAKDAARRYSNSLKGCSAHRTDEEAPRECFLNVLLGRDGIRAAVTDASASESTVTHALTQGSGPCASLVAATLALTEAFDDPFLATVLRDHVLLAASNSPSVYYETLLGGERQTSRDVANHASPPSGEPIRVDGRKYLAYYLDNLAARLVEEGREELAETFFNKALSRSPRAGRIRYNYGTFLLGEKRYDEALDELDQAIRLGWNDAFAFSNRGVARWKLGRMKNARRDFERAIALDPANSEARRNLQLLSGATD